jgi:RNA polymerase sigma-54 factor
MSQAPGLYQVQKLSLQQVLAPQLQQSLHLLQVPSLELSALVHEELQQNPLLEEVTRDEPQIEAQVAEAEREPLPDDGKSNDDFQREFEVLSKIDDEWREYFSMANSFRGRSPEQEEQHQHFFDSIVERESLQQHLLAQLDDTEFTTDERKTAELLIGSINDDGYLLAPIEEIAINTGVPLDQLDKILHEIQTFHPVGVGARNLRECLLIQLDRLGKTNSLPANIVRDHLDDLGRKRYPDIARALDIEVDEVQELANFIATLEPKPGRMFTAERDQYVAPDIFVQEIDGQYTVALNDDQVPRLRISNTYKNIMAGGEQTAEAREYIREKLRAGKFLIKSIHQRQQTIQNIAKVIVEHQQEFLEHGTAKLKPLTMACVAEKVGVHETTVSRAVANKYMQTPHGLFEMRYFFTTGYTTEGGATLSNASVKEQLAKVVAQEDPSHPLSDQEIVAILKEKGIPIARRTVAKYRDELDILPSNLRKKF